MTATLHLIITTPSEVLLDRDDIAAVRAEDESGDFGMLPGHLDVLTVLPSSVLRWHAADGSAGFCAVQRGVLTLRGGQELTVACRQATLGDDLDRLEAEVHRLRAEEEDTERRAKVEQTRMHAAAVRRMMQYLQGDTGPHATEDLEEFGA
ncbi:MAG: F0F1 ATP synthase subunit epsilon [Paracoccaceae bacterium]